jgi:hypothetical protein
MPDQVNRACQDEMHFLHRIAAMKQWLAAVEMPLAGPQALQIWFNQSEHDIYHVSLGGSVARGT